MEEKILSSLLEMISDNKRMLVESISLQRTKHLTVVVENIYQSHNASAVVRSCDCFGIQEMHVISSKNSFKVNREVAMGSGKWVDVNNYTDKNTSECLSHLKNKGYKIVATLPHHEGKTINELDITQPTALVFGTEQSGLSQDAIDMADDFVKIPMYGFAESFNISVSAALCLQVLREKLMQSSVNWQLSEKELIQLKTNWCKTIIYEGEKVYQNLVRQHTESR